jgi:hypothetical protein
LKTTLIVQLAPAASGETQVVVSVKSAEFVPLNAYELMVIAAAPEFDSVIAFAALATATVCEPNARDVGDSPAFATAATAVPDSAMVCLPPVALSITVSVAVSVPAETGLNVTDIVQLAAAASVRPQVVVFVKEVAFVPEKAMLLMVIAALPVFVSVAVCAALDEPTVVLANVRVAGVSVAVVVPAPLTWIVFRPFTVSSATRTDADRLPVAVGVKINPMLQLWPEGSGTPTMQVVVFGSIVKSVVLPEPRAMWKKFSVSLPTFDSSTVCVVEEVPTARLPKFSRPMVPKARISLY